MINQLNLLVNSTVVKIIKIHDYWQMVLDIGVINCYNPIKHCSKKTSYPYDSKYSNLYVGKKIKKVVCKDSEYLSLIFENQNRIVISLVEEDWEGPEAVSVNLNSGKIIVYQLKLSLAKDKINPGS